MHHAAVQLAKRHRAFLVSRGAFGSLRMPARWARELRRAALRTVVHIDSVHTYTRTHNCTYARSHTRAHKRGGVGGGVATAEAAATRRLPTTIYNLYADIDFEAGLYFLNLCKLAALLCGARIYRRRPHAVRLARGLIHPQGLGLHLSVVTDELTHRRGFTVCFFFFSSFRSEQERILRSVIFSRDADFDFSRCCFITCSVMGI